MPFYEYQCSNCQYYVEVMQKITDAPLKKCPSCGRNLLKKLISAPVFRLKGSGWYETDFKSDKDSRRNLAGGDKEAASSDSAGAAAAAKDTQGDTRSDTKSDTKGEAKSEAKGETRGEAKPGTESPKATPASTPAAATGKTSSHAGRTSSARARASAGGKKAAAPRSTSKGSAGRRAKPATRRGGW